MQLLMPVLRRSQRQVSEGTEGLAALQHQARVRSACWRQINSSRSERQAGGSVQHPSGEGQQQVLMPSPPSMSRASRQCCCGA